MATTRLHKRLIDITATKRRDENSNARLISYADSLVIDKVAIGELLPSKGVKSITCFKTLVLIWRYPRNSVNELELLSGHSRIINSVSYLVSVDMISPMGRPRLIIPFQRFKVDTAYVITAKGEGVLRKILG